MTGRVTGDYSSYGAQGKTPAGQLYGDMMILFAYLQTLPPNSPLANFLDDFRKAAQKYCQDNPNATQADVQNFINSFFSPDIYLKYAQANANWSDPKGFLTPENLALMMQYQNGAVFYGFALPSIPSMNSNVKNFLQQLQDILSSHPNGVPESAARIIDILVNAALANQDGTNLFTSFEMAMLSALLWWDSSEPTSIDSQLAAYLLGELANLGPDGTFDQLREWALAFVNDPNNGWVWTVSEEGLTQFGKLTGVLMTAKQYQSEMAGWLREHKADKGSPLYQFVKWIENLIDTFRLQNPQGKLADLESYLDQYLSSDIYKMFPGLTFAQVSAFYQADMPPGMQPPPA